MAVVDQVVTDKYAAFNADCMAVLQGLKAGSVHLTLYSPPFQGLGYVYSSDERDLSNSLNNAEFWHHYDYIVRELHRVTMPGRLSVGAWSVGTSNALRGSTFLHCDSPACSEAAKI